MVFTMTKTNKKTNDLSLQRKAGETVGQAMARIALEPGLQAAISLEQYQGVKLPELTLEALIEELEAQTRQIDEGDLSRPEAMLNAQAHTLDAIFNNLARRAISADLLCHLESFLRLGLKAQAQCRATLATLADIRQPRNVAYVHQANIAHGPQQVNNGVETGPETSRTEKNGKLKNKLLSESENGPKMDARTTGKTGGNDPAMEAVGEINRAENI